MLPLRSPKGVFPLRLTHTHTQCHQKGFNLRDPFLVYEVVKVVGGNLWVQKIRPRPCRSSNSSFSRQIVICQFRSQAMETFLFCGAVFEFRACVGF